MTRRRFNKADMNLLQRMRDERAVAEELLFLRCGPPTKGTMRTRAIRELDLLDKVIAHLSDDLPPPSGEKP